MTKPGARIATALADLFIPGHREKRRLMLLEHNLKVHMDQLQEHSVRAAHDPNRTLVHTADPGNARTPSDVASRLLSTLQPLENLHEMESHLSSRMDELLLAMSDIEKGFLVRDEQANRFFEQLNAAVLDTKCEIEKANEESHGAFHTALELYDKLTNLPGEVPSGPLDLADLRNLAEAIENGDAELVMADPHVRFLGHPLYFDDLFSVYVVFKEIYLYEDYYADLGTDEPRILDCGAHIGMAALYFKSLYSDAQVICFEPDPDNFRLLERNTERYESGVITHPLAITADGAVYTLARRENQSMASSLYSRSSRITKDEGIEIKSTKLSAYLDERVDLLKLDIEGAEDTVLEECRDKLENVNYLFIEFHTGDGLPLSRLRKILEILDEAQFTYQIERAREYQVRMMHRPFTHLNQLCTHVIHAKNTNFGHGSD